MPAVSQWALALERCANHSVQMDEQALSAHWALVLEAAADHDGYVLERAVVLYKPLRALPPEHTAEPRLKQVHGKVSRSDTLREFRETDLPRAMARCFALHSETPEPGCLKLLLEDGSLAVDLMAPHAQILGGATWFLILEERVSVVQFAAVVL